MSTGNIVMKLPTEAGLIVVFETRQGEISYLYEDPIAIAAILAGSDPASFSGVRMG